MSLSRSLGGGETSFTWWKRPTDWLTLPIVGTSEQKIVGLLGVYDTTLSLLALSAAGNYTVDWGDGTVENFTSGATAEHSYTYSTISNSTLSSRGYKQVVVTITPQSGQNLTSINLNVKHSSYTGSVVPSVPWLDVTVNGGNLTSITIGGSNINTLIEQATISNHNVATANGMFSSCSLLQSVSISNSTNFTTISSMFSSCTSLKYAPFSSSLTSVTNSSSAFSSCTGLIYVPPSFALPAATNVSSMFSTCSRLTYFPSISISSATTIGTMFSSCAGLTRCLVSGATRSISFLNSGLSASAINEIFTNLGTASGTQTITVTGNRGAATCDTTIATAKGWTVAT